MTSSLCRTFLLTCWLLLPVAARADDTLFAPPGAWIHDLWFARHNGVYHAFYLQAPQAIGDPRNWSARHDLQQIGHATSTDLKHWQDRGCAVTPLPRTWRSAIATGSVVRHQGRWYMAFSATGAQSSVVGLAVSDDLMTWTVPQDSPLLTSAALEGSWNGRSLHWQALADPYLYPEAVDGWYYMFLNARVQGDPLNSAGCLAVVRSRNLQQWESAGIAAYPEWCDRMETPCVWRHDQRWYVCFGTAQDQAEFPDKWTESVPDSLKKSRRVNAVFTGKDLLGPYLPAGEWWLDQLPDGRRGYIYKVLPGLDGMDVLLTSTGSKISPAYPVEYPDAGGLRLRLRN